MLNSMEAAMLCAGAADDKKAYDILVLDLRGLTYITDYFVICSCGNTSQIGAVADWIDQRMSVEGKPASHIEGLAGSSWVLMDFDDVVVHIFDEQTRAYYSLERLWGDAPRVPVSAERFATT
jgi:ribosome-associated protein